MNNETIQLTVDGVALPKSEEYKDKWLPDVEGKPQFSPYEHQVKMDKIVSNNDPAAVLNEVITGGGKTMSYAVPALKNDKSVIAVYPTNALASNQKKTIEDISEEYFAHKDVYVQSLTGDAMLERRETIRENTDRSVSSLRNSEQVKSIMHKAYENDGPSFILTNPDVLVGIIRGQFYGKLARAKMELLDMVVVDEFHQASQKGRMSLLVALDKIRHRADNKCNINKFIFLSATPDNELNDLLQNEFGRPNDDIFNRVTSKNSSKNLSDISITDSNYSTVMPEIDLTLESSRIFHTKDKIMDPEYIDLLQSYVSNGRSIVILDGVEEVNEAYSILNDRLDKTVEAISGLRSDRLDHKLQTADVLVANSTLEVGVDIDNVQQLVFSAFEESQFLQRLGRLRGDDDELVKSAYCFTKADAIRSFRGLNELPYDKIPRDLFYQTVERQLGVGEEAKLYNEKYAPVEMFRSIQDKQDDYTKENAKKFRKKNISIVQKHCFKHSENDKRDEDIAELWDLAKDPIGRAMQSYRNSSISALIYDEVSEKLDNVDGSVKTYQIERLIRFGDVEFLTKDEFHDKLRAENIDPSTYTSEEEYVQSYAWLKNHSPNESLRDTHIEPTGQIVNQLTEDPKNRKPFILNNLQYTVENTSGLKGLDKLNRQLSDELRDPDTNIIGYVTEGHPSRIQTVYNLDNYFFTTPIANLGGNYTIAFGENALYLDCHVKQNLLTAEKIYNHKGISNDTV